jgi:4-hydroxybenzoate polyprenyltransferase
MAQAIAARLELFDEILASDGQRNLKGPTKAAALVERYGTRGFDYVGDSRADLPVWREAREAVVIGSDRLARAAAEVAKVTRRFTVPPRAVALLQALRPHQWSKNILLFLPLIAAHQLDDGASLLAASLAFVVFGLTASSVYLLNDLLDLPADRAHPRKRERPFAAGTLSLSSGVLLSPLLLLTAVVLSLVFLPPLFTLILGGYYLLTTAYSFGLKRKPVVDVLVLAALYTARVIAGAAAVAIVPSFWLLAFSMFMFLSLALAKRYTELDGLRERGELTAAGRGWHVDDLPLVQSLGTGAGLACVLVLALYIDSEPAKRLYATPQALWLVCPLLLYWISRLWFKTHRGKMHDDPVVFALRDRVSLLVGALTIGILVLALSVLGP